jgi:hypothetical protein
VQDAFDAALEGKVERLVVSSNPPTQFDSFIEWYAANGEMGFEVVREQDGVLTSRMDDHLGEVIDAVPICSSSLATSSLVFVLATMPARSEGLSCTSMTLRAFGRYDWATEPPINPNPSGGDAVGPRKTLNHINFRVFARRVQE